MSTPSRQSVALYSSTRKTIARPALPGYVVIGHATPPQPPGRDRRCCPQVHQIIVVSPSATAQFCRELAAVVAACAVPGAMRSRLRPGREVTISRGPLMGMSGVVDGWTDDECRVVVAVRMLGVGVLVTISRDDVDVVS